MTYLEELDLPDPERVLAHPESFALPDRGDRQLAFLTAGPRWSVRWRRRRSGARRPRRSDHTSAAGGACPAVGPAGATAARASNRLARSAGGRRAGGGGVGRRRGRLHLSSSVAARCRDAKRGAAKPSPPAAARRDRHRHLRLDGRGRADRRFERGDGGTAGGGGAGQPGQRAGVRRRCARGPQGGFGRGGRACPGAAGRTCGWGSRPRRGHSVPVADRTSSSCSLTA